MPTTVIHEIVSKKIANKYKDLNNYNFYLGNIAPDAVNLEGFADKPIRWHAHLRDSNLDTWHSNIISFYNKNKNQYNELFLKGYLVHILTDIIYDRDLYSKVVTPMSEDNLYGHDAHKYMQKEMNSFGNNNRDYQEVTEVLNSNNTSYDILNIDKKLLLDWKNKVINEKLPSIPNKYITMDIIDELVNLVIKDLIDKKIL